MPGRDDAALAEQRAEGRPGLGMVAHVLRDDVATRSVDRT